MKMSKYALPVLTSAVLILLSSCSPQLTPFTQKLYENYDWSENELKKIQFYVSEDIVLRKLEKRGASKIEDGEIKVVSGEKVEEVVIRKGTPGVLIFKPKEDRFAINFEDGRKGKFLMFGPNPKRGNRYSLLASEWEKRGGKITYNDKSYYTTSSSAYAHLLVNLKKVKKRSVRSRTAKGAKVD